MSGAQRRGILVAAACALVYAGAVLAGATRATHEMWDEAKRFRMSTHAMLLIHGYVDFEFREDGERLILETKSQARLLGASVARSRSISILDAATGRPIEHQSFTPKAGRHFVFDEAGYTVHRLDPGKKGYMAPLAEWKKTGEQRYETPVLADGSRAPLADYFSVLLALRRLGLARTGDEDTLWIATSRGPRRYTVRVDGERERVRKYRDLAADKKVEVAARELRLLVIPFENLPGTPGFLGTDGETEIWAEAGTKMLIEVSGKVPKVPGRVIVELDGFARKASAPVTAAPPRAAAAGR